MTRATLPLMVVSNPVTIWDDGFLDTQIFSSRVFREYDFIPYHVSEEGNFSRGDPEPTGALGPGVGRVLDETGVPAVPCFYRGLDRVLPIGSVIPRIGRRVETVIGPPFSVDDLRALPNTQETWQKIAGLARAARGSRPRTEARTQPL